MSTPTGTEPKVQASSVRARHATLRSIAPVGLVVVVPLLFLPAAFGPFHAVKWLAVCVLVPAGLAVCAATGTLRWPRWKWFLPFIVVSAVSTLFGVAPWMSLIGSPNRNNGLLALFVVFGSFVLGASVAGDVVVQRRVLRAAFVTGGVIGALAVAERLGLDIASVGDAGEITRGRSTWGSATFAAAHLVIVLPIAVAHLRSRDSRWRIAGLVCCVAILAGLLATGTRGGWLAALVSVAVLAPAWLATGRPAEGSAVLWSAAKRENSPGVDQRRTGRPILVVAGVVAAVAAVGVLVLTVVGPQLDRASGIGRLDLWSTTPSVIADRPILGAGPDTQRSVLPAGIDEDFEREHGSEELHDRAHSLPLDTLVTTGILGLAALVALLGVLARDFVLNLRRELVPTAIAAGLAGYLVTLLFAFGDPVMDPIPWMLAGLLWVAIVPSSGERSTEPPRTGVRMITAIGFGCVAVAGLIVAGGEVLAETRLDAALDGQSAGDLPAALDELESAVSVAPARFDLHQAYSRIVIRSLTEGPEIADTDAARSELIASAFRHLDDAQAVAGEDPDLLMDRAELLTAAGDPDAALEVYDRVVVLYPQSFRAHLGIGLAASQLNQLDRAEEAWTTAVDLAPGDGRALVNLGILYERGGDPDAAAESFEAALEIDPADGIAAAGLARVTDSPEN
ncbi:MAG: tetratricopeptide repeat protein [Microthrixaceae bacterium]